MKVGKPKSKRTPVRLRHKIQKASAAKQRKDRKLAKKNPEWRSKLKKDPGIPNLFPYKDKLLAEIEETKRRREEERLRRREEDKARRGEAVVAAAGTGKTEEQNEDELLDLEDDDDDEDINMEIGNEEENPMAALLASAKARASAFNRTNAEAESEDEDDDEDEMAEDDDDDAAGMNNFADKPPAPKDSSQRAHDKAFKSVISAADVLLYVLDARDPIGTRSSTIEQAVTSQPDKRLIFILNKIDLVPSSVLRAWLLHLRRSFPTLPLRASAPASNAQTFNHHHKSLTPQATATNLIKSLKAFATRQQMKRAITVGIIGYPNVGKSSVVNALTSRLSGHKGGKECPVGAEAGITTALREVKLDNKIKLLDSPGIIFPSNTPNLSTSQAKRKTSSTNLTVEEQARLILLNAIPPKDITDPVPAVSLLLDRLSTNKELFQKLLQVYDLPALLGSSNFEDGGIAKDLTTDFLLHVARKRGRLGKGGVPNLHAAAQTVVTDWRDGRIQGWVEPPKADEKTDGRESDKKQIVTEWAEEFKIEGLWGGENDEGERSGDQEKMDVEE